MKTRFPADYTVDFDRYLAEYMKRPDAIRSVPTKEELAELARKAIVREQLVLLPLPAGEPALEGDTAVLKVAGPIPRYNKEKVTVTLGRGLYNRELETALIGKCVGEEAAVILPEGDVRAAVLELKRKQTPEPTDDMVVALDAKAADGTPLRTVKEYTDYVCLEKTTSCLAEINYYVISEMLKDAPALDYDEEDVRILGQLERDSFRKMFLEKEGIDLEQGIPKEWKQDGVETFDDFIRARGEWYRMKIRQCLLFLKILDLPCEGKTDPLDHYEVLQELQMKMFDLIKEKISRGGSL